MQWIFQWMIEEGEEKPGRKEEEVIACEGIEHWA
ncbi:hypothetical protein V6Z11_A07G161800 [Gossypium hirsutum]